MALIPSAPNEWPQNNQIDDQKAGSLNSPTSNNTSMASVGGLVMDQKVLPITPNHHQLPHPHQHQTQQQQQQQKQNQEPLRCPRCDSTNTKFCYYNNYSLSQPRHFCKACKRYWTRGGTLRNVPVGGGCRKNKRVKRPTSNNSCSSANSLTNTTTSANSSEGGGQNIHDLISSASNHHINPLFFGIPANPHHHSDINFPFSRYDLQNPSQNSSIHHHGGLGLGFANSPAASNSSGLIHGMSGLSFNGVLHNHHPVNPSSKQIFQDLISSNANPMMNVNINPTSTTDSPTLSSLLASTIQMKGGNSSSNFQTLLPPSSSYEDHELQMKGSNGQGNSGTGPTGGMFVKDVKMELEGQNRSLDHHSWGINHHQVEDNHTNSSADPSLLWGGSANNLGAWLDPSNSLGSSVPSLI